MRVGHGRTELPLIIGEPMGGYADRAGGVVGQLDPLEVHAVTFATGEQRFALIVADLICVNADIVARIRGELTGRSNVDGCWVAATHTHASPEAGCEPGGAATPPGLADRLVEAACTAVKEAIDAERESRLSALRTGVRGLASRRGRRGRSEESIPVDAIAVESPSGRLAGVLAVVPVHPTVLPAANQLLSADLTGGIRAAVADRIGGAGHAPWSVVATGAGGDISTRHTRTARTSEEVGRLGSLAAKAIGAEIDAGVFRTSGERAISAPVKATLTLPAVTPAEVEVLARQARDTAAGLDRLTRQIVGQGIELAGVRRFRPHTYVITIEAIRLAGITLVAVPGELFLSLGEAIHVASQGKTIVLGYANGYVGYLPDSAAFGRPGYETLVSPVSRGSGERVMAAARHLVRSLQRP